MKRRKRLAGLLLAASLIFSGCGTPIYEMEAQEQELIVSYSAYVVAKYNVFQKDGYVPVSLEEEEEPADTVDDASDTGQEQQPEPVQQPAMEQISLTEALGLPDEIDAIYKGSSIQNSYDETNENGNLYFYLDPNPGNVFLVMKVRLINSSDSSAVINMQKSAPDFLCCYNGTDTVEAEKTFALKVLPTYTGQLKAEKSVNTFILFQIPESEVKNAADAGLQIRQNGVIKSIIL